MFIYNISLNKIKFFKYFFFIAIAALLIALMAFFYNLIQNSSRVYVTDTNQYEEVFDIPDSNYANMLKDCYENLDNYVGKKFKYSGFVHRLYDFEDNQFVLAREMFTSPISNNQAEVVIVGFLCEYDGASSFDEKTWVEVEGTITEGFYHSKAPVIKIDTIKQIECPEMPFINPPDGGYVTQQ
ncbi:MAG: hypothetical protein IJH12_05565 [Clostridia bacterium]|nr:hypothetical protein [Clostridia bacterium]